LSFGIVLLRVGAKEFEDLIAHGAVISNETDRSDDDLRGKMMADLLDRCFLDARKLDGSKPSDKKGFCGGNRAKRHGGSNI
jgi:hypothetical protein